MRSWPPPRVYLGRRGMIDLAASAELRIGSDVVFMPGAYLAVQGLLEIGDFVYFNRDVHISCLDHVSIGREVRFGERVSIHDENHVVEPLGLHDRAQYETRPVTVGESAWIGAGVVLLPGASVGRGSVIGAGSVVTGTIPEGVLAVGAPARVIRELKH